MQIHFKGSNYELTSEISGHARKKIKALEKYLGPAKRHAYAYVDIGKETGAHANGRIWRTDINLDADGVRFYAKAIEETVEAAVDKAMNELGSELRTYRERKISLARKGGLVWKSLIRGLHA